MDDVVPVDVVDVAVVVPSEPVVDDPEASELFPPSLPVLLKALSDAAKLPLALGF